MKKIALILAFCVVPFLAHAVVEPKPAETPGWVEFEGGKYLLGQDKTENIMILLPDSPLATERYAKYGNVIEDPKTRSRRVNKADKNKITAAGLGLYEYLINLKNEDGWFKFNTVVIEYSRITIIKDYRVEWEEVIPDIVKAFK